MPDEIVVLADPKIRRSTLALVEGVSNLFDTTLVDWTASEQFKQDLVATWSQTVAGCTVDIAADGEQATHWISQCPGWWDSSVRQPLCATREDTPVDWPVRRNPPRCAVARADTEVSASCHSTRAGNNSSWWMLPVSIHTA